MVDCKVQSIPISQCACPQPYKKSYFTTRKKKPLEHSKREHIRNSPTWNFVLKTKDKLDFLVNSRKHSIKNNQRTAFDGRVCGPTMTHLAVSRFQDAHRKIVTHKNTRKMPRVATLLNFPLHIQRSSNYCCIYVMTIKGHEPASRIFLYLEDRRRCGI